MRVQQKKTSAKRQKKTSAKRQKKTSATHLDAVKMRDELVVMELIGLSCARISPSMLHVSMFHSFKRPPRHPLSRQLPPGMKARPQIQSLVRVVDGLQAERIFVKYVDLEDLL